MLKTLLLTGISLTCINAAKAGSFAFSKIDVPGDVFSFVNAIDSLNTVVGGYQLTAPGLPIHGFAWASGTTTLVTVPGETRKDTFALVGVNKHGIAVGAFFNPGTGARESFIYDLNTAKAAPVKPPAGYMLDALKMSNTDTAVGVAIPLSGGPMPVFTKTFGKPVTLLRPAFPPNDTGDLPLAVASSGEIVGDATIQPGSQQIAFSYLNVTYTQLSPLAGGSDLDPDFVNDQGVIAGSYLAGAIGPHGTPFAHGFVQRGSQLHKIDFPAPSGYQVVGTTIAGVTRTGYVLGSYSITDSHNSTAMHGFVRQHGVWSSFDVPGAVSTFITKINEQGSIAGSYTDSKNVGHAFVGICAADQAPCTQ